MVVVVVVVVVVVAAEDGADLYCHCYTDSFHTSNLSSGTLP